MVKEGFRTHSSRRKLIFRYKTLFTSEAVVQMCSVKKVFLKIPQNSQENICAGVSFLIKLQASGSGTGVFL